MSFGWADFKVTIRMLGHLPGYLRGYCCSAREKADWFARRHVPSDFIGICVANAPDAAVDDYVIAHLHELGLRHVRLDFTYGDQQSWTERFLERLLEDGFAVCLHPVQPFEEACDMLADSDTRERWRAFIGELLDKFGSRLALIEIGATCNRRKWCGYSPGAFLEAWRIAWEEARGRAMTVIGPNVTDFEPVYNIGWLAEFKRQGIMPAAHTDNLFVERATEPEAFDHKILGRTCAGLLRYDLVRKARLLRNIGAWFGVPTLICPHVAWSLRRIGRFLEDTEQKQADYLVRYLCLAAASGALTRVYWGPLIGQREGLIDDGTTEYPDIPHVTYYEKACGELRDYRLRPAFGALKTVQHFLPGAVFTRKLPTGRGLEMLEFEIPPEHDAPAKGVGRLLHVVWTFNGRRALVRDCYSAEQLREAAFFGRDGARLDDVPDTFSESPLFILFPAGGAIAMREGLLPDVLPKIVFANQPGVDFMVAQHAMHGDALQCVLRVAQPYAHPDMESLLALLRERAGVAKTKILRNSRNLVWLAPSPWDPSRMLAVKQFRRRPLLRRLLDFGKSDRALRSWNGAQELIRRGIATPEPVACLFRSQAGWIDSYYVCDALEGAQSVRDVLTAFAGGAEQFAGRNPAEFYEALSRFLQKMHTRGVFFRDLSAGNILLRVNVYGALEFMLIDTTRARFYAKSLPLRLRLLDLMRLCHPLHWLGRNALLTQYLAHSGLRLRWWMKIPFVYYDGKHRLKNALKRYRHSSQS